jgi:hypothetical protein
MGDLPATTTRRTSHLDARPDMGRTRAASMIVMVIILAAIAVGAIISIVEN